MAQRTNDFFVFIIPVNMTKAYNSLQSSCSPRRAANPDAFAHGRRRVGGFGVGARELWRAGAARRHRLPATVRSRSRGSWPGGRKSAGRMGSRAAARVGGGEGELGAGGEGRRRPRGVVADLAREPQVAACRPGGCRAGNQKGRRAREGGKWAGTSRPTSRRRPRKHTGASARRVEDPRPRLGQQSRLQIPKLSVDPPRAGECLAGSGRPALSALGKPHVTATAAGAASAALITRGIEPVGGPLALAAAAPQPECTGCKCAIDVDGELTKSEKEVLIG